ncbi:MAG: hypothetical protein JWQ19_134 [Subtercola sp.]|nr:hypothetical protein [Subtercola sp.]
MVRKDVRWGDWGRSGVSRDSQFEEFAAEVSFAELGDDVGVVAGLVVGEGVAVRFHPADYHDQPQHDEGCSGGELRGSEVADAFVALQSFGGKTEVQRIADHCTGEVPEWPAQATVVKIEQNEVSLRDEHIAGMQVSVHE